MPWQHPLSLLATSALLLAMFALWRPSGLFRLLRRTRWFLASLLLVYAFATPGDPMLPDFPTLSPTRDGLVAGLMQVWRLAALLVGLAWVLAASRDELLVGLYVLLRPLRAVGVDIDRVAVRIWLTLGYAERTEAVRFQDWRERFRAALSPAPAVADKVVLDLGVFTAWDLVALVAAAIGLIGLVAL